ncbi:phage tail tape measure protein [Arthrobacter sp. VKM Ac-2550]|uniref:phage tail tape measure protein n=1 Tax=Crystallibacter permensis TaxID=1938888 RepID=UPI00222721D0|nr:phage tail tape measure protein [Arthrobacter sp. VKM Ac-2550]MCW2132882.1 phage tail tape measure protein, TP901 family, core region [Arthrobacter sp. VKM Ac-2550]
MAARSVIVRLEAQVGGYVAGLGKAATETDNLAKKAAQARKSVKDNHQAMEQAGGVMLGFGAVAVAGLGAATKAAMDWETAWAGVTKTVDGTPEQMAAIEGSLRDLAKTLPATHEEIAGVAEAAGQLGVAREDVVGFTKTMIDLSETTNLTADEAATSIAQISNVMGTMAREGSGGVQRFGAALVALGNDGASTEAEIVGMASRLSGAMKLVGASESDLLAMANAMASVGIEAQLGGGVMSRVMQRMYADVMEGGEGLHNLADVAGMSASEFATAFENDPVRATDTMIKGLNGIKESGGNVIETMSDLGIKGTEETSVILRLAGAGDLLTESLDLGAKAWEENSALAEEAQKRYETTEAKIQVAWNGIKDAAIDAGAVMLPVVQGVAEAVSGLAAGFGSLPNPVQDAVTVFAGLTGGAALLGGAALTLIPKIAETREAFRTLNASGSKIPGTLGKVGKAAGVAAGAIAALGIAGASINALRDSGVPTIQEMTNELLKMGDAGSTASLDEMVSRTGFLSTEINGVGDAVNYVGSLDGFNQFQLSLSKTFGLPSHMQDIVDSVDAVDSSLGQMVTGGNTDQAAEAFKQIATEATAQGMELEDVLDLFPQYKDQLIATAIAAGGTATDQEILNAAMGDADPKAVTAAAAQEVMAGAIEETGVALGGVIEDMDKFLEQLFAAGILTMNSRDAHAQYQETLDSVSETIKTINESGGEMGNTLNKNKSDFDLTTEAGRLANDTFQGLAQDGMAEVKALAEEGMGQDVLQEKLSGTYDDLIATAGEFGITGEAAETLARKILGVPDGVDIDTWMDEQAKRTADETKESVENIPGYKEVHTKFIRTFETHGIPFPSAPLPEGASVSERLGLKLPGRAGGGDLDIAPGPKGVDSQLFIGAKGEHVLTAQEVDLMGGQQAVYQFRNQLRTGRVTAHANGGEIGSMYAPAQQIAAAGGGGTRIDLGGIVIQGATDADAVRRAVVDEIQWKFQQNGVRLG